MAQTFDTQAAPAAGPVPTPGGPLSYIHWGPVFAGAVAAAALAFVLHSFAGAIGLAVSSTAPTWRDASIALILLSGLYLMLVALAAYGAGGYLAGRVRSSWATTEDEIEFRDGAHGILVWALATLLTAILLLGGAQALTRVAAPSGGPAGAATSVGGENIIAYDLDRLFRAEKRPPDMDMNYTRSEAARILLTASGHTGVAADDRAYLVRLTAARTGLAPADAERRVDTAIANARDNIARARRSAVILAFMAGASALVGAAAAWFAAGIGGQHRDRAISPPLRWNWRGRAPLGTTATPRH
jgi:hypothetical protein